MSLPFYLDLDPKSGSGDLTFRDSGRTVHLSGGTGAEWDFLELDDGRFTSDGFGVVPRPGSKDRQL